MVKRKQKYSDNDQRAMDNIAPIKPDIINPINPRRRYAHEFSGGRQLKLITNAKGRPVWRRVPDNSIVFYGKQLSTRRTKVLNSVTGKYEYKKDDTDNG